MRVIPATLGLWLLLLGGCGQMGPLYMPEEPPIQEAPVSSPESAPESAPENAPENAAEPG